MATVRTAEQAEAARAAGFRTAWHPEDYRKDALERLMEEMAPGDWLQLPQVCEEDTLEMIRELCTAYREKLGLSACTVPVFEQYVLAEFISSGELERYINRRRRKLRQQKG